MCRTICGDAVATAVMLIRRGMAEVMTADSVRLPWAGGCVCGYEQPPPGLDERRVPENKTLAHVAAAVQAGNLCVPVAVTEVALCKRPQAVASLHGD